MRVPRPKRRQSARRPRSYGGAGGCQEPLATGSRIATHSKESATDVPSGTAHDNADVAPLPDGVVHSRPGAELLPGQSHCTIGPGVCPLRDTVMWLRGGWRCSGR
ncbi:hypothetical protein QF037_002307 [Streptomyces canus]|nr:hypothetical protein [Streptomyces canus]